MDHDHHLSPQPATENDLHSNNSLPVLIRNDPTRLDYPRLSSSRQEASSVNGSHAGTGTSQEASLVDGSHAGTGTFFQRIGGYCFNWKEMKMQFKLAGPLITYYLLALGLLLISVMFVGHLGELELASASIAASFANVTGSSFLIGLAGALDTLCGQAYGAGQYQKLAIYMQRAMLVLNMIAIALAFVWANMGRILLALGQDSAISSKAGIYSRWLIPTLFAYATSQPLVKFLQAQSLVTPVVWTALGTLCCHLPICWFLVYKSGLGFVGAALANSISYWINVVLLAVYVRFSSACSKTRAPLSREALHDWKGFFKLALPSAAMTCLEWWAYEVLVVFSGWLPDPELQTSALSICLSTASLLFMVPFAISAAVSTRVSNELGAGRPQAARASIRVALGLAISGSVILAALLLLIRKEWAQAYSDEEEVIDYVTSLIPFLAGSTLLDTLNAVLTGVVRGAGWQKVGAGVNLGAYYIVGLPVGSLLAFVAHLAGKGLVIGLISGSCAQLALLVPLTFMANWDRAAEEAAARVDSPLVSETEPLLSATGK